MIRFGLCCLFNEENIKFKIATAKRLFPLAPPIRLNKVSELCLSNVRNILKALKFLNSKDIKAFRISSRILPLYTHPKFDYTIDLLKDNKEILNALFLIKNYAKINNIRLSFHPDQFVLLSSSNPEILERSLRELEYHAKIADLVGADVVNIHLGGSYGNKTEALKIVEKNFNSRLSKNVRNLLTIENDDRIYTPEDVYRICKKLGVRMVYDVHHHRCNPDGLSVEEVTEFCISTWKKRGDPYFHISSPKDGWDSKRPQTHADYIDIADFPLCWLNLKLNVTIDVEAKNKELAIFKLIKDLNNEKKNSAK